jgi:hypothetical protein
MASGWLAMMQTMDEWLYSEETSRPFSHCLCCKVPLVEIDAPWLVNKEIIRGECIMEYAVCQPCRDQLSNQLCEESKAGVRNFLEREIDWNERVKEFMLAHDPTERFQKCIACCTPREELDGFGISALFDSGGSLITGSLPLLICLPCIGKMTASLSAQSREVWQNFLTENFTGPPNDSGFSGLI